MWVRLALTALVNSVFINMKAYMVELTCAYVLPIVNNPEFILNQYQEVGQKPAHTATPTMENTVVFITHARSQAFENIMRKGEKRL